MPELTESETRETFAEATRQLADSLLEQPPIITHQLDRMAAELRTPEQQEARLDGQLERLLHCDDGSEL